MIYYAKFKVPQLQKSLLIAKNEKGVCRIFLNDNEKQFIKELKEGFIDSVIENNVKLKNETKQILEYFEGKRKNFNLTLFLKGTKFQTEVLMALAKVKYGETVSYSKLAELGGRKKAVRAAATCCAINPLPIVIPCHRVIAKDGAIGGFGGGIPMKKLMLKLEGSLK